MSDPCSPPLRTIPVGPPPDGSPPQFPFPGETRLILEPDDLQILTANRETDATTALRRGVAEYLGQQSIELAGRLFRFEKSLNEWAEPEDNARYPLACSYSTEQGSYGAQSLTPQVAQSLPGGGWASVSSALELNLTTELWATDPIERMAVVAMIEDAMQPVDWMTGFRLELPHYFNVRARYEPVGIQYLDDAESSIRRFRVARVSWRASVPVIRVLGRPRAQIKVRVDAVGDDVSLEVA